ncbi:MAG TPA: rhodanese-like domain-containing protein [Gammaproteobacteria bacterium]|nr:rhodanese-like domain-containing protein [Gammaproteobacteria bacterium]
MHILNIAGYRFVSLSDIPQLKISFMTQCQMQDLKGTILLSEEGININLAGEVAKIEAFVAWLNEDTRFAHIRFHQNYSTTVPFRRLRIKQKKEIITLRQPTVDATSTRASSISPHVFKQWLDEKRDMIVLDVRNDYEIEMGAFEKATHLNIADFNQFPEKCSQLQNDKPIVMYCTGGIRCEKAGLYLQNQGYTQVYQLDTGILGYFATVGGAHYRGECFVFDERVTVPPPG